MLKAGVMGACLLAFGATARAQDDGTGQKTDAAENQRYPLMYIDRPLTLPALMAEASLSGGYWWVDEAAYEEEGIEDAEDYASTSVAARFGITDWWQVSASTRYWVQPEGEWSQFVRLASRVSVLDSDLVDVAPGAEALLMFDGDRDTEAVPAAALDVLARIQFCNRIFRRTALYLGDDLVSFGIGGYHWASLDLNAMWVSQMNRHAALRFSWQLFHSRLYGDIEESHGPSPLDISVVMSPASWIDISLGYQLRHLTRGLIVGVAARF